MPEDLFDEPERRASERLAAARRLVRQGKHREALDAINLAIQLAPGNAEAFRERAAVFDRMGLAPQAEADRRRADELAAMMPPPLPPFTAEEPPTVAAGPDEGPAEEAPPSARSGRRPGEPVPDEPAPPAWEPARDYAPPPVPPAHIPREADRGPGAGAVLFAMAVIAVFLAVIGAGALLALDSFGGDSSSPAGTPFATGTAGPDGTGTTGAEPTPAGSPSTAGSPYSLSGVVAAWTAKGMSVQTGGASTGFTGFNASPSDVTMTRGGSTAIASVFVYDTAAAAQEEWNLPVGDRPSPKGSRTMPSHVTAWWNANVVVVLRSDTGGLQSDALDGFINLGG